MEPTELNNKAENKEFGNNMGQNNTHYYDNKLENTLEILQPYLESSSVVNREQKLKDFAELRKLLLNNKREVLSLVYYDKLVEEYIKNDRGNYDPVNNIDSTDLLHVIFFLYYQEKDREFRENLLKLFKEQLYDMRTGFCQQGRSIRMIQTILPFIEF